MNKRIIASALTGCFALSAGGALAVVPPEVAGTKYEEAVSVLSALNIMNGDENGEYRLDDKIIRSEVTKMAVTAMGLQDTADSAKGSDDFDDVSADHWANGYIHVAVSLGLVEGDGDGNFRPNDEITYREAVAIMVRAAGYEAAAQNKGGYPSGYLTIANDNKMTRGVEGGVNDPISRGNVAILTNNTLETNKMEQTGFGNNIKYEITDKTLLEDNLETIKFTGQITAVSGTSLAGSQSVNDGEVRIDDTVYGAAYPVGTLLGYNVTCYAKKNSNGDRDIILAMPQASKNKTTEISSDLFSKLTTKGSNNAVEYYADENSSKLSTAVISNDAQLIYNNKSAEFDIELLNIADKSAYMTLLDTDNDSEYDIVFITEYKNLVLDYVSSNKAVGKDKSVIRFDEIDYKMYNGFNEVEPSDLKEWDVLAVAESLDKTYTEIYVSRNSFKGKVSAKGDDGYTIDGKLYKVASDCTDSITVGQTAEFCLDISGKIAAIKAASNVSDGYAYLTNAYKNEGGDNVIIKIVDKSGDQAVLTLADKLKLNGSTVTAAAALESLSDDGKAVKQLITYTKNASDKVTELNIAKDMSSTGGADTEHFSLNAKLDKAVYNSSTGKLGSIRISDSTIVFDVSDTNNISITDKSIFENNQTYTGYVYDMSESFTAGVVVLMDAAFKPNANASTAVVKKLATGTNKDDAETDILTALVDGKEVTLYAADDTILVKEDGKKLAAGDLIQYKTDADGNIAGIRVLFDASAKDEEFTESPENDLTVVYGKVTKRFSDSFNVTVDDGEAVNYSINDNTLVYIADTSKSKHSIKAATFDDVTAYDEDENNRVFIRIYDDSVKEIVVVK